MERLGRNSEPIQDHQSKVEALEAEVARLNSENRRLANLHRSTKIEFREQLVRLELINDVARQISTRLDVAEMLDKLIAQACATLSAEYGYALLMDEDHGQATFAATAGPGAEVLKGRVVPLVGTVMGTVIRQGKALLINDTSSLPEFFSEIDANVNSATHSLMVVPLKTKRTMLGALIVTNKQMGRFTNANLDLLTSLSQLACDPIENARLFSRVQQYSQDLEEAVVARTVHLTAVNETSRAISSIVAVDELFDKVTRLISELFNQARVGVGLRTGNYLTFQKIYDGEFKRNIILPHHQLRIDKEHILGHSVLTGEAGVVEPVGAAELYRLERDDDYPSTALVVPLTIGGKTTGLIVVQSRSWLASRQQDLETLQSLASQVAVAMENSRLFRKSREMATIQERTRLARDMHDGIAQNLAYLLLRVDRCLLLAENASPKLEDELENISQVIRKNIEELRRHIFDLRPVGLEGKSIFSVVKQMSSEFGEQANIVVSCRIFGGEIDLPHETESSLYRIFQEALSNIRRHAQCSQVWITLRINPDKSIDLIIKDDGTGFDPGQVSQNTFLRRGLGLVSIQERVRGLGGKLLIDSAPGKGTCIQVNVPYL